MDKKIIPCCGIKEHGSMMLTEKTSKEKGKTYVHVYCPVCKENKMACEFKLLGTPEEFKRKEM